MSERIMRIRECHCASCQEFDAMEERFDAWLRILEEGVIEGEFGYEPGEFDVFPSLWRPLFAEGLTPRQAWQRALDGFAAARRDRDASPSLPTAGEG